MPIQIKRSRMMQGKMMLRRATAYLLDWSVFALSGYIAFQLRFDGQIPAAFHRPMQVALAVWFVSKAIVHVMARLDGGNWRYTSVHDALHLMEAMAAASAGAAVAIHWVTGFGNELRSVLVLDWLIACLLMMGMRFLVRAYHTSGKLKRPQGAMTRTLIYGAGWAGLALLWELRQNQSLMCEVIGFIDDDPSKARFVLQGKPVFGKGESLAAVVRRQRIEKVLIAIPSATGLQMARILKFVFEAGVDYKTVPGLAELIEGAELGQQIRAVAVGDLLGRQPVQLDQEAISTKIQGKVVMVTGAAGSIGSELCRQIALFKPRALVGFDSAETPLFHLERELHANFPTLAFYPEIGNITCSDALQHVMEQHRPSVVYHAAAYKHVPMMEEHIFAAVENNILGTWNAATTSARCGVEDFVMISTDKAVRPTSMMGATKRVAELVSRSLQKSHGTRFVVVRFGNVLGSNGSVVPIFKEQIAAGGPITVTHPDITRYFMTIPEASQLVLQACAFGKGGEIFVLDMGEPVKIVDLAKNLILLSGLHPDKDIQIKFTGLRPGEKLYEELNLDDEQLVPTPHRKIKGYLNLSRLGPEQVVALIDELRDILHTYDPERVLHLMMELIPDYVPNERLVHAVAKCPAERHRTLGSLTPKCENSAMEGVPSVHRSSQPA